jgi:hypothetical protein
MLREKQLLLLYRYNWLPKTMKTDESQAAAR